MSTTPQDDMVEVTVRISKIQDGDTLYQKGQRIKVDREWAKARGNSVTWDAPKEIPPAMMPSEKTPEIIVEPPKTEEDDVQSRMQGEGKEGREERQVKHEAFDKANVKKAPVKPPVKTPPKKKH